MPKCSVSILMPLYHFELMLAGIILLSAMAVGGISLWLKRKRDALREQQQLQQEEETKQPENQENPQNF